MLIIELLLVAILAVCGWHALRSGESRYSLTKSEYRNPTGSSGVIMFRLDHKTGEVVRILRDGTSSPVDIP